ncbi:hypothetical protein HON36_01985 [Candidatus Parcubacteria bacterium]|jgi:hypothetical protein|nr:hypothetical protein [Candidatus Parcubacteria bacterium]MBT7228118.1 hypothetical protein [Candidatus Parcubacteria bacterium]
MFITPHTSIALWITTKVSDPMEAFIFGVVSHFILDIIPHGDESIGEHKKTKKGRLFYMLKVAFVDVVLATALVFLFLTRKPDMDRKVMYGAVAGAWMPDLAWLSAEYFKIKILDGYVRFHAKVHNFFGWEYAPVYGVPFQIGFTLFALKLAF